MVGRAESFGSRYFNTLSRTTYYFVSKIHFVSLVLIFRRQTALTSCLHLASFGMSNAQQAPLKTSSTNFHFLGFISLDESERVSLLSNHFFIA
jgi:hypothetical protein